MIIDTTQTKEEQDLSQVRTLLDNSFLVNLPPTHILTMNDVVHVHTIEGFGGFAEIVGLRENIDSHYKVQLLNEKSGFWVFDGEIYVWSKSQSSDKYYTGTGRLIDLRV